MKIYKPDEISAKHLSNDDLLKFHRRSLSDEERRIIENHLKQCELCSDALNGIAKMNNAMHIYNITHELKKRMKKRLTPNQTIFSRFDLISILLVFCILGLILFLTFYFLMARW